MSRQPKPKALLAWSSGKDSAWSLHCLRQAGEVDIAGLLTTFNMQFDRVAMHAVRSELVDKQAQAAGLTLFRVSIHWPCSNEQYEQAMRNFLIMAIAEHGITHVAFGDLFLQDIRDYRERRMAEIGLTPLFPIWGEPTPALARKMIKAGLRAKITCIDPSKLPAEFAGRTFDEAFLDDLPANIDPCGENGEFHSYTYAGPMFAADIPVTVGEIVERDNFVFADLTAADS